MRFAINAMAAAGSGGVRPRAGRVWRALSMAVLLALSLAGGGSGASQPPGEAALSSGGGSGAVIPASRAATNLAVITIKGEINAVTAFSVQRRIRAAADGGADGIVFDIDSPGGEVSAGLEICRMIKQSPVQNTIAWVNPNAYSMAAIIALACREIVLAPFASMGDAAPIAVNLNPLSGQPGVVSLGETERQKVMAPLIAEVVESARLRGYDENLVQAFITLGVELWMVRETATGRIFFVTEPEFGVLFGTEPPRGTPAVASGVLTPPEASPWRGEPALAPDPDDPASFRSAFPRLDPEAAEAIRLSLEDRGAVSSRPVFSRADRGRFEFVEYVTDGRTLLTLKEAELKRFGFADPAATIRDDEELRAFVGATNLRRLDQSWSESLVSFMTQGISGLVVRGLLIIVFLLAIFMEMSMPGVGVPTGVALVALAGLVVPPMLIGAATWWALALILSGVGLLMLEIFVFPGFGVPGVAGVLMLFAGLIGTFADAGQLFPGTGPGGGGELAWALSVVLLAAFIAGVGMYFFTRYTDRFPLAGRLVLGGSASGAGASVAAGGMLEAMAPAPGGAPRLGATGTAVTPLRPSGTADFDGALVDVVAEYGFIEPGRAVRVVSASGYRVGVEEVRADAAPGAKKGQG